MVEHSLRKGVVGGSIPLAGSNIVFSEELYLTYLSAKIDQIESEDMSPKKTFRFQNNNLSEEDKIKRRAVVFGFLTLLLGGAIIIWGIPLFIRLVGFLGDLKSEKEQVVSEDTIPPLVPRLVYIPEATNSANLPISGFTEPGAKVKVKLNGEEIETQADEEGNFSIEKLILNLGENTIITWAEDESNNQSEITEPFKIIYDTQEPELGIESPQDKSAVEEQTIEVRGTTEPDARTLVNDHIVIIDEEGKFSTRITLKEGGNTIIIVVQDKAGNETKRELTVTYLP